jgi:enoyl-CoA hydratase
VEKTELETIIYEKDGPIARIVLNRPEKANVQTAQQVWDFEDALTWANRDEEVKVLVVKANGKGFCACGSSPRRRSPRCTATASEGGRCTAT